MHLPVAVAAGAADDDYFPFKWWNMHEFQIEHSHGIISFLLEPKIGSIWLLLFISNRIRTLTTKTQNEKKSGVSQIVSMVCKRKIDNVSTEMDLNSLQLYIYIISFIAWFVFCALCNMHLYTHQMVIANAIWKHICFDPKSEMLRVSSGSLKNSLISLSYYSFTRHPKYVCV